ncbi:hypothetical protein TRM7557_01420 [Tritonibacter multivorans]|uniref:Metallopeptidase n=1 Tax=Tritonibacter multivorans TaxID=928856 RepID=A0A0P1G743_9RHOB|nr:DUF4344 domain-containing metallopeptidase [Tritonibacter multivorans]MDA7421195.1 DUF4344 domain-containing metallopeptidase [Tritonibacter multivorans]CUH77531.1 hypothetical protein TRM7557_01420 [Tritonibacter multivorans]SFD33375.1 Putative metallopeptidase [Tritonibacter multivorans]
MLKHLKVASVLACLGGFSLGTLPALAEDQSETDAFVEANILGIFYHELGHALIDIEGLPIFGQEEDAADVASIFLIDALFEEEAAQEMAWHAALGFWAEAETHGHTDIPWWDVHGPDAQRFYNTVCLFYGADPEARADFARNLDLPEDRADTCPEEFDQANHSWGAVLDDIGERGAGNSLTFTGARDEDASLAEQLLAEEVDFLNENLTLQDSLTVTVESCGEANAFYDPNTTEVIFCTEFEDHLYSLAQDL